MSASCFEVVRSCSFRYKLELKTDIKTMEKEYGLCQTVWTQGKAEGFRTSKPLDFKHVFMVSP